MSPSFKDGLDELASELKLAKHEEDGKLKQIEPDSTIDSALLVQQVSVFQFLKIILKISNSFLK